MARGPRRLVDQENLGCGHQRARERQHLLLAAAHAAGELPAPLGKGAECRRRAELAGSRDRGASQTSSICFATFFPRLAERRRQLAGSMSGGEQQMLTLARALMTAPDSPDRRAFGGLAPSRDPYDRTDQGTEGRLWAHGADAEQNFNQAIRIADRGLCDRARQDRVRGRFARGSRHNELIHKLYMGIMIPGHARHSGTGLPDALASRRGC